MKNVLIVDIGKQYGGAERYVEQIAESLDGSYNFFFLVRSGSLLENKLREGSHKNKLLSIKFNSISLLHDLKKIKNYIKTYHIEVVHTNGINSEFIMTLEKIFTKTKNINYITTVHGIAEYDRLEKSGVEKLLFSKIQVLALKNFDNIIAVSNSIKDNLLKKRINENKITVVEHGIKEREKLLEYYVHQPFKICYVGRLEKVKNALMLIQALDEMDISRNMEYICDIYGSGSQYEYINKYINEKDLTNKVILKGYVEDVDDIYHSHDLLIQPSVYESFGLTIIEAMQAGIPVLCSNVGGMAEIVEDNVNGVLFDINNIEDLAEKINYIMCGIIDLKKIRVSAFETVNLKYTLSRMKEKTKKVYEKSKG